MNFHSCILSYLHTRTIVYLHTCIFAWLHTFLHVYLHTCIPAFIQLRTFHWITYNFSESGVPPNSVLFGGAVPPNSFPLFCLKIKGICFLFLPTVRHPTPTVIKFTRLFLGRVNVWFSSDFVWQQKIRWLWGLVKTSLIQVRLNWDWPTGLNLAIKCRSTCLPVHLAAASWLDSYCNSSATGIKSATSWGSSLCSNSGGCRLRTTARGSWLRRTPPSSPGIASSVCKASFTGYSGSGEASDKDSGRLC